MTFAALFDLDGTLLDTPRAIARTLGMVLEHYGAPPRPFAELYALVGLPLPETLAGLLGWEADSDAIRGAVAFYRAAFARTVLPAAPELVFPGVREGLAALAAEGFGLAVATNKYRGSAVALLDAAGFGSTFRVVVGADDVPRPKPDPAMAFVAITRLRAAGPAVMVGDTTHDIAMAHAAGIASIGVTYGAHDLHRLAAARPSATVDSFPQVVHQIFRWRQS